MKVFHFLFVFFIISIFSRSVFASNQQSLKVLTWGGGEAYLPRSGQPQDIELQYLQLFASEQNRKLEQIKVTQFDQLFSLLLAGHGDVIAANLTVTEERKKFINFSDALIQSNEYFLMGKKAKALKNGEGLNGREVVIHKGKSYRSTAIALQKAYPKMRIRYIDNSIGMDLLYDRLASGEYDLTIQDENLIKSALDYRDDIKRSIQASKKRDIAWAVSPSNNTLLQQLNIFLKSKQFLEEQETANLSQWQKIKKSGKVRFVLRNNLSSYYIWRGELLGFHYELAKRFAEEHKLAYEIIVAPDNAALLDYLIEDKADIALGFLTPTAARKEKGVAFSRPYHYASELLIGSADAINIETLDDLTNERIYVRPSSAYWDSALRVKKQVNGIEVIAVDETEETESIIDAVGDKRYEMTIADSHIVDLELTFRDDIQSFMSLGDPKAQSWAIRSGNKGLLTNVDVFIKKYYKGLFYNVIYNKYFKNKKRLDKQYKGYVNELETGVLSPFDKLVKIHAKEFNFDWRLLIAQMHQESRFDPNAVSIAGAQGLFQVMPKTAQQLGIVDLHSPESGIEAGIRYMDWVRERMQISNIPDTELTWFTLASYNAGAGHVRDAIRLAKKMGWREDVWFDNVERAMLLLSQNRYASKARYGYVRGLEPVTYVREIKRRYDTYLNITENN